MRAGATRTTCPYCGVGCGLIIEREAGGGISVRGDPAHPANLGRICSKGAALAETIGSEGRLTRPLVDGRAVSWDEALDRVAEGFRRVIDRRGPGAVAFYVSGQLLTEDYYVANKLMKGFIGSANIDTNSRLCMSSSVVGHKRAFGSDTVPGCYQDLEQADLVVLTGSNTAWCHPVLFQRIQAARKARPQMRLVVIDPRATATSDGADLHLPLRSGSDSLLFNGLLSWLARHGHVDRRFVERHTTGHAEAVRLAQWQAPSAAVVADQCGLQTEQVEQFFRWFGACEKTVTVYSQGINQSTSGSDKVNAIVNCHLLSGRIGRAGMGPFSVTGQPNAMGGREVGALANQLAAHMGFDSDEDIDRVRRFWQAPALARKPGLNAVELFRAVERGEIGALWIMATNPAVSLPDNSQVRRALERCELVVVSDCVETDTTRFADILLPVKAWGEKDGTVTNSERRISRQRPFLPPPAEARADWWILSRFAQRLGFSGFDYRSPREIFDEHAALSGFENGGTRDFDIGALQGIGEDEYDALQPFQWPFAAGGVSCQRLFAEGGFFTADRRAQFVAVTPRPPATAPEGDYPFTLNTGRVRDHWHTMTRTGLSPKLTAHTAEPYAELHVLDAQRLGIADADLVRIESRWGGVVVRARCGTRQQPGALFVPMHWNDRFASNACIGSVVNPCVDPFSGQPEFKHTPVRVSRVEPAWYGFLLSRDPIDNLPQGYWCRSWRKDVWYYELAGDAPLQDPSAYARALLGARAANPAAWCEFLDSSGAHYRAARFDDGRLGASLFISSTNDLPGRDWLVRLFAQSELLPEQRLRVLAGAPGKGAEDVGRVICSCFSVGVNTLMAAIRSRKLSTPEQIGEALQAGTNCGSCIPELRALIAEAS
ncbi:MAG: molybdopterin-dependent oxidoreductase [Gammaproteobacteria bacterium]|nr:molybdopterin-dependent oxidoreductase [Gammaproteobacteria bacterium]